MGDAAGVRLAREATVMVAGRTALGLGLRAHRELRGRQGSATEGNQGRTFQGLEPHR